MLKRTLPFRFSEGGRYAEDYELWLEMALQGVMVAFICQPLAGIFKPAYGHSGLSSQLWAMEKGAHLVRWRLLRKRHVNLPAFVLASIWSLLKYVRRVLRAAWLGWVRE